MKKSKRDLALWLSVGTGGAYVLRLFLRIGFGGGVLWSGIPAWMVLPHAAAALLAVVFCAAGAVGRRTAPLRYGAIFYAVSAALFPPFHVFLLLPAGLMAAWYLRGTGRCPA